MYAPCEVDASARAATLKLCISSDGLGYALDIRDRRVLSTPSAAELIMCAAGEIDRATVEASSLSTLMLHASAVELTVGTVVLTGSSGGGKSTVAAGLTRAGCRYVGDEVIGLGDGGDEVVANPKPLKLDGRARKALQCPFDECRDVSGERLVGGSAFGICALPGARSRPVMIVQLQFREGAPVSVTALSRGDVVEVLADQCFNFARLGPRGLDTVVHAARGCAGVRLEFGDLEQACSSILALTA
jgi:hypothetical protein